MNNDQLNKRRGRPQKVPSELSSPSQLFSIHDNIFHAAILFYTTHIFSKTPSCSKFNPTIGYSIYQKLKSLPADQKQYYHDDAKATQASEGHSQHPGIVSFFINSMTFAPRCVIDQYYALFNFILGCEKQPTSQVCLAFLRQKQFKFINFDGPVLQVLEVRGQERIKAVRLIIDRELMKLLEIISWTVRAIQDNIKVNVFASILDEEEDLYERGTHTKGRKKIKPDSL